MINSKWIKDLNIRLEALLQGKIREYTGSNKYMQGLPQ
jgi:hypothetical protein